MKKAFKTLISVLLCLAMLMSASFTVPGLISYATENIARYSVYVYEMDVDGAYGEPTTVTEYEAEAGSTVTVPTEPFLKEGFCIDESKSELSGEVLEDGSTVLKVFVCRNKYTLTFDYNGGHCDGEYGASMECYYGSSVDPEIPVREGCTFLGWSTDGIEIIQFPFNMPDQNVMLYAVWEFIPYNITFNANGGYFNNEYDNEVIVYTYVYGEQISEIVSPVKEGYHFLGWATQPDAYEADYSLETMPFYDVNLYAVWQPNDDTEYKVEYYYMNADGTYGDYPTETVMFTARTDETATQRYFECPEGFSIDETRSCLEDVIRGDGSTLLTVYLQRNRYTACYDANGGIFDDGTDRVVYDVYFGAETPDPVPPTREGYFFCGWTPVTGGEMPAQDVVFTAVWDYLAYNSEWYVEGVLFECMVFEYGEMLSAPERTPQKTGYEFVGWTLEENSDIIADIESMSMPVNGITFYAYFVPCTDTPYRVEFYHMNIEGEYEHTSTEVFTGVTHEEVEYCPPCYEGFTCNSERSILKGVIRADSELVLEVFYDRNMYTVIFDNSFEIVAEQYYYGSLIPEPEMPCREGYDFGGWVDTEGNHVEFPYTVLTEEVCFVAEFFICNYTVHYDLDGGVFPDGEYEKVYEYGAEVYPEAPIKDGFTFKGWVNGETGEEIILPMQMPAQDIVIRAEWVANEYVIRFYDDYDCEYYAYCVEYASDITPIVMEAPQPIKRGFTFVGWMNMYTGEPFTEGMYMPAEDLHLVAIWEINIYCARWIVDGDVCYEEEIGFGYEVEHPEGPEKEGYIFEGWADAEGNIFNGTGAPMPDEDITFIAVFSARTDITYTVEIYEMDTEGCYPAEPSYINCFVSETDSEVYADPDQYLKEGFATDEVESILYAMVSPDGATVLKVFLERLTYSFKYESEGYIETVECLYGSIVVEPYPPYKEGYIFDGWIDEDGNYVRFPFEMPAEAITVHAVWYADEFTITFDPNGGELFGGNTPRTYSYYYDDCIEMPEDPMMEGFTFAGWVDPYSGDYVVIPEYMPACDLEFTAAWVVNEYRFTLVDGFGTIIYEEYLPYGVCTGDIFDSVSQPEMEGYTFVGWIDEETSDTAIPENMPARDVTYTARWERNYYTVEWINDGETWNSEIYEYGAEINLPQDPEKEGYVFNGWLDNEGNYVEFPCIVTDNQVFRADWMPLEYSIVFDANGAAFDDGTTEIIAKYHYGSAIVKPVTPCREGYYFVGWSTEPHLPYLVNVPDTMPAYNLTLFAIWEVEEYTLSFDDGFGNNFLTLNMEYGEDLSIVEYITCPENYGYIFLYWEDMYTCEELILPATMPSRDLNLIAVWDQNEYEVIFDFNGGENPYGDSNIHMVYRAGDYVECETPSRIGCVFVGWQDTYGNFVDMPMIMPAENIYLTAIWEYEIYTITFMDDYGYEWLTYELRYEEMIPEPIYPTKEGFTFAGWDHEVPVIMPAENLVFTAVWTVNRYRVYWDMDGEIIECDVEFGEQIIPPVEPTKQGYVFAGWSPEVPYTMPATDLMFVPVWETSGPVTYRVETYTMNTSGTYEMSATYHTAEKTGTVSADPVIPEGFELNNNLSVLTDYADVGNDLVLKIFIDRQTYRLIKYVDGKGSSVSYLYGSLVAEPVSPEKDGYVFVGWDKEIPRTMPANDVTVTAVFRERTPADEGGEISFYITPLNNVKLNYGETLKVYAYTRNLPANYKIEWYVDSKCVTINPSSSGKSCTVTATSSGGAAISAWIIDENGQKVRDKDGDIIKDTEVLYSEVNTWLIIVSFFKKLFKIDI